MSSEERKKILQMVEEGKITAEDAAGLMRALGAEEPVENESVIDEESGYKFERGESQSVEFEEIKSRAHRFAAIPLWGGVFLAVTSAWGMFAIQQNTGVNFWFFCLMVPMLLGVLLIALGSAGQNAKWLYVNVDRSHQSDWPRRITLGFPISFRLTSWFMKNFGHTIRGLNKSQMEGIVDVLDATGKSSEPLVVHVDDDDGDRVQVYIG